MRNIDERLKRLEQASGSRPWLDIWPDTSIDEARVQYEKTTGRPFTDEEFRVELPDIPKFLMVVVTTEGERSNSWVKNYTRQRQ